MKVSFEEIRDELIDGICNDKCPESIEDSHCPDHSCLVWRCLTFLDNERFETTTQS